jgi:antitoxin MazE
VINVRTTIQKWGNSQGIRIPKIMLDDLEIAEGGQVELLSENGLIIIKPAIMTRKIIEELFDGYTGDCHEEEMDWGDPVGNEIW